MEEVPGRSGSVSSNPRTAVCREFGRYVSGGCAPLARLCRIGTVSAQQWTRQEKWVIVPMGNCSDG